MNIEDSYQYCLQYSQNHYENFPVASFLLPKHLRRPVAAIYTFARIADDLADEGDFDPETRSKRLNEYHRSFHNALNSSQTDRPEFPALIDTINHYQLPVSLFDDLVSAFKQDIEISQYQSWEQLYDYCRRSANPVGRLLNLKLRSLF